MSEHGSEPATNLAILVLGVANSGKSTFINWVLSQLAGDGTDALEQEAPVRDGLAAETSLVKEYHLRQPGTQPLYPRISLIDTPGFDHTDMSNSDVLKIVAGWLQESYKGGTGIGAVIYMHDISCEWVAPHMRLDFEMLEKYCGREAISSGMVTIVTSKWDRVSTEEAQTRQEEMVGKLWAGFRDQGGRVIGCPDAAAAGAIVGPIVNSLRRGTAKSTTLQMQTELCVNGTPLVQTLAGRYLGLPTPDTSESKKGVLPQWPKLHGLKIREGVKAGVKGLGEMLVTIPRKGYEKEKGKEPGDNGIKHGKHGKVSSKLSKKKPTSTTETAANAAVPSITSACTSYSGGQGQQQEETRHAAVMDTTENVCETRIDGEGAIIMEKFYRAGQELPANISHPSLALRLGEDQQQEIPPGHNEPHTFSGHYQVEEGGGGISKEDQEVSEDIPLDGLPWDSCAVSPIKPLGDEQHEEDSRALEGRGRGIGGEDDGDHKLQTDRDEGLGGVHATETGGMSSPDLGSSSGASAPANEDEEIEEHGDAASTADVWHDAQTTAHGSEESNGGGPPGLRSAPGRATDQLPADPREPDSRTDISSPPASPGAGEHDRSRGWWPWWLGGGETPQGQPPGR